MSAPVSTSPAPHAGFNSFRLPARFTVLLSAPILALFAAMMLAACGGGGDAAGTGAVGDDTLVDGGAFTVGGTITGLTGTLVLQNNGADDLSIEADGDTTFTFATGVDDGATYEVSVLTQPTGQLCTITSASGTIAAADVSDVAVACGAFVSSLTGKSQKGPFLRGSEVIIQVLNESLTATGTNFNEQTFNNLGHFTTNINIDAPYLEIITSGFYFDEVTGVSDASISLRSISPFVAGENINVNLLTQLARGRVKALVTTGSSYDDALAQAQGEILALFHVTATDIPDFDTLDIEGSGTGNAILIGVSAILMQAAHDAAASSGNAVESELQDLLVGLGNDLNDNGTVGDAALIEMVRTAGMRVDMAAVRDNLERFYALEGETISIASFEDYVDRDGDGFLPINDDNEPDAFSFALQDDLDPDTLKISEEITITGITGDVLVKLDKGWLYLNCADANPVLSCTPEVHPGYTGSESNPGPTEIVATLDDTLRILLFASADYGLTETAMLTIGDGATSSGAFALSTFPLTEMPFTANFTFGKTYDPIPSGSYTSDPVTIVTDTPAGTGVIYSHLPVVMTADAALNATLIKNGTGIAGSNTTTVVDDDTISVSFNASPNFETAATVTLSIGLTAVDFLLTTCAQAVCLAGGVFVAEAADGGNDANLGEIDSPLANIQTAIDLAATLDTDEVAETVTHPTVHVAAGIYNVSFEDDTHIKLKEGVDVLGGWPEYVAGSGTNWGARLPATNTTVILDGSLLGGTAGAPTRAVEAMALEGITTATLLDGFKIVGGSASFNAGIHIGDASPTITNNIIEGAQSQSGYGIFISGSSSAPDISNNAINGTDGSANNGTAIYITGAGGTANISNNNPIKSIATTEAYGIRVTGGATPNISGNTIDEVTGNMASGMLVFLEANPVISGNSISGVLSGGDSHGINIFEASATITGNTQIDGGTSVGSNTSYGIYAVSSGSHTVAIGTAGNGNTISGGTAYWGYGIRIDSFTGTVTITDNIVNGGTSTYQTTGMHIAADSVTVTGNTIDGGTGDQGVMGVYIMNSAGVDISGGNIITGGTAANGPAYGVYITGSTGTNIADNTIDGGGGPTGDAFGIYNNDSSTTITGNTIYGGTINSTTYSTRGIGLVGGQSTGDTLISGNSISGGSATSPGGAVAIHVDYINSGVYSRISIHNNNIFGGESSSTTTGIYVNEVDADILNNTIHGGLGVTSSKGIMYGDVLGSTYWSVVNNIIFAGDICIYATIPGGSPHVISNNDLTCTDAYWDSDNGCNLGVCNSIGEMEGLSTDYSSNASIAPLFVDQTGADIADMSDNDWNLQNTADPDIRQGGATIGKLNYVSQLADFYETLAESALTGETSDAMATLLADDDRGDSGTLTVRMDSGTFQDGETINSGGGIAIVSGTLTVIDDADGTPRTSTISNCYGITNPGGFSMGSYENDGGSAGGPC